MSRTSREWGVYFSFVVPRSQKISKIFQKSLSSERREFEKNGFRLKRFLNMWVHRISTQKFSKFHFCTMFLFKKKSFFHIFVEKCFSWTLWSKIQNSWCARDCVTKKQMNEIDRMLITRFVGIRWRNWIRFSQWWKNANKTNSKKCSLKNSRVPIDGRFVCVVCYLSFYLSSSKFEKLITFIHSTIVFTSKLKFNWIMKCFHNFASIKIDTFSSNINTTYSKIFVHRNFSFQIVSTLTKWLVCLF